MEATCCTSAALKGVGSRGLVRLMVVVMVSVVDVCGATAAEEGLQGQRQGWGGDWAGLLAHCIIDACGCEATSTAHGCEVASTAHGCEATSTAR